jgi:hypothetical protein
MHSPTPQVVVLGVYLGAPGWDEHVPESLGLGVVAYSYLIVETLTSGIRLFLDALS